MWITIEHGWIHSANEGVILFDVRFCGYQDTHTLAGSEIYKVSLLRDGVHAIDFYNGHLVLIKFYKKGGKGGHVDDSGHVRFPRSDGEACGGVVVEDGRVGNRFSAGGIGCYGEEGGEEIGDLLVVPVCYSED